VLIRKAIGIEKGSGTPNTSKVGKISRAQLEEIAKAKTPDLTAADLDAAVRTIAGSARSMGVDVEESNHDVRCQACQNLEGQDPAGQAIPDRRSFEARRRIRQGEVQRIGRRRRQSRHRRVEVRSTGARFDGDAARHRQVGARGRVHLGP
jgi:hypothetical protein